MKIIILKAALKCICAVQIIHLFSCQTINGFAGVKIKPERISLVYRSALPVTTGQNFRNEIPVRAVSSFIHEFKDAENVAWDKVNNGGYIADFISDSIRTRVYYDSKGRCGYILKKYGENKMPSDMRDMVKKTFIDHAIIEIAEIILPQNREEIVYKVLIKNATNFKILRIFNMGMKITGSYNKP